MKKVITFGLFVVVALVLFVAGLCVNIKMHGPAAVAAPAMAPLVAKPETTAERPAPLTLADKINTETAPWVLSGDAGRHVGERITVRFVVKGGFVAKNGKVIILNSEKNFRSPTNLTIAIFPQSTPVLAGVDPKSMIGKEITVIGKVKLYKERPEIVVSDPGQLKM